MKRRTTAPTEADRFKQELLNDMLESPLFSESALCPDWAMGFIEGLKKGLEAIKEGKIEQIDSGFLRQCSEAVLSARQTVLNTNSATSSGEEMFADSCGKILGAIAKYDLGVMHVTRAMESRYPPRRTPQQTTR